MVKLMQDKHGFTLIEVVFTISIIIILSVLNGILQLRPHPAYLLINSVNKLLLYYRKLKLRPY
ncbi:MAG: prepilin-type N-terminal cleavage/methylation domain-containing protein [Thomasclavelia sp.]